MNKSKQALIYAFEKGYRVVGGEVFYKNKKRKLSLDTRGYYKFTVGFGSEVYVVLVHRLVGYQKYGSSLFDENMLLRHLDGNQKNNLTENIKLGTHQENMQDIPKDVRLAKAMHAASFKKKKIIQINSTVCF